MADVGFGDGSFAGLGEYLLTVGQDPTLEQSRGTRMSGGLQHSDAVRLDDGGLDCGLPGRVCTVRHLFLGHTGVAVDTDRVLTGG